MQVHESLHARSIPTGDDQLSLLKVETLMGIQIDEQAAPEAPLAPPALAPALSGKRANWTIAHAIEGAVITWQVKGAGELKLDLARVSAANRERAALHGFVQRVSDAAAMARDSKTGASATPQEKHAAMKRLVEHYESGAEGWSPQRASEGVGRPRMNGQAVLLVRALGVFSPTKSKETIEKFVKELSGGQIAALLHSEQLREAVELAREEIAQEEKALAAAQEAQGQGVDAEELLKGL